MFLELNNFLDFDNKVLPKKFVVSTSDDSVDHNFVLCHLLMLYLKTGRKVFQLNLTNDDTFYSSVCQKLAINLKTHISKSAYYSFSCPKLLKEFAQASLSDDAHVFSFLSYPGEHERLQKLQAEVLEHFHRFVGSTSSEVLFMIDDVSSLLNLGLSNSEILKFIHSLRSDNTLRSTGTLFIGTKFNEHDRDPECFKLCTYLSHLADATIDIRGLSTGHSRDITGQISVTRTSDNQRPINKQMHFRLEDRGVKLFPLGLDRSTLKT